MSLLKEIEILLISENGWENVIVKRNKEPSPKWKGEENVIVKRNKNIITKGKVIIKIN